MGVDISIWRTRIGRFRTQMKRLGHVVPGGTYSESTLWYGAVVLMLLVMSGVETNPGPCDNVREGFLASNVTETLHFKVGMKRTTPMPTQVSKKQRFTECKPALPQILNAISVLRGQGKYNMPLHLMKPHTNPLFTDICKELLMSNTRKALQRTRYLWKQHVETMKKNVEISKNDKCSYDGLEMDVTYSAENHSNTDIKKYKEIVFIDPNQITTEENEMIQELNVTDQNYPNHDDNEEHEKHGKDLLDDELVRYKNHINPEKSSAYIVINEGSMTNEGQLFNGTTTFDTTAMTDDGSDQEKDMPLSTAMDNEMSVLNSTNSHKDMRDARFWEFWITTEDWSKVKDDDGKYSWFFVRELIKMVAAPVFKICLVCFTTHRLNKVKKGEPAIVYYGKCKHEGCRQFRFDLTPLDDGTKLAVSAYGELQHKGKLSSRLSGFERSAAKQELLRVKALAFRSEKILKAEAKTVLSGNLLEIRSLDVFRQARAEAAKMMDKHNDDGIDLLLRYREDRDQDGHKRKVLSTEENKVDNEEQIMQKVGEPLHVYMFSRIQLKTLLSCLGKRNKICVLHIDSTGSVVKPLTGDKKTVYYYSGCVNVSGKLLPILDFVSCQHDVASITSFFMQFVHFQKKHFGNKKIFSHIVIDFSTALVPATILAWNRMSVLAYLVKMFRFCTNNHYRMKNVVTVHLCCSHFMHMAAGDFSRLGMNKEIKKFYLCCIATLINCRTFEEFKSKVQAMLVISKTRENNLEVEKAKSMFEGDVSTANMIDEIFEKINDSNVGESEKITIYKSSPFYKVGKEFEEKFNIEVKAAERTKNTDGYDDRSYDVGKNCLHCSLFWDLFLTKYMPYAPLWSGFCIRHSSKETCEETRFSNAPVEGWFKIVKDSVLDGLTNVKVGRFVERLTDRILTICKEIYLEIPSTACNKKKVKKGKKECKLDHTFDNKSSIMSVNDENVEEKWLKKPTQKNTYFSMKFPVLETRKGVETQLKSEKTVDKTSRQEGNTADEFIGDNNSEDVLKITIPGASSAMKNEFHHDTKEKQNIPDRATDKNGIEATSEGDHKRRKIEKNLSILNEKENEEFPGRSLKCKATKNSQAKITQYGPLQLDLQCEDYESLQGNNWVSGAAIDAVAENMLKFSANYSYFYAGFEMGTRIVNGEKIYDTCFINIEELKKNQYLLLPYSTSIVMNSHWCLIVVDLKNKFVYHFDSLKGRIRNLDVQGKVLKFLENINEISGTNGRIDLRDWSDKSDTITYPKQQDDYNCGIFVLYYMFKTLEMGLKVDCEIVETDIYEFRKICLRTLEDPNTSSLLPAMENGLIDSPRYYTPDTKNINADDKDALRRLTVAYTKNKNMGKVLEKISQEDFVSLTGNNWLTSTMVDFCNATFVRNGQFCFAIGEATIALQEGRPKYTPVFKPISTELKKMSLIFVPYNPNRHYTLYVIDLNNKLVTHLDPLNEDWKANEEKCNKIKGFLRFRNYMSRKETIDVDELKFVKTKYPLQNDGSSCGVYVVYYLSVLSERNKIDDINMEFDSKRFREELQLRCLRVSLPVGNLCLACGNGSDQRRSQWCQCYKCGRWLHFVCMKTKFSYEKLKRQTLLTRCIQATGL